MTFCIAMKVEDGLVGIADTRVTSGVEYISSKKVSIHQHRNHAMFVMTSGLRSARDKAVTYFDEVLEESDEKFDKLYKAVNAFATQVRRVQSEDRAALKEASLEFNLFSIIGGQLENDREHKLYLLYPQANWVEVTQGTPYYMIGESSYGKPILSRAMSYEAPIPYALKLGYLAFEATRMSATDVDYPIDVVLYRKNSFKIVEHRYERDQVRHVARWWKERLNQSVQELPEDWLENAIKKMP